MRIQRMILITVCVCLTMAALPSCYTVPVTGRTAFVALPSSEEFALGVQAYDEAKQNTPTLNDPATVQRVRKVANRIIAVSDYPDWNWEVTVFDDPETPNAWCLPGGKIGVYSGLLPYTKTDGQLATVIAHEIGHAVARHGGQRMSEQMVIAVGAAAISKSVSDKYLETAKVAYGVGSELFVTLPYSRKDEYEADRIGLIYMARAGYNPEEAVDFWEEFSQVGGDKPPEFLSTHPADENRAARIRELLPEAMAVYEQSRK